MMKKIQLDKKEQGLLQAFESEEFLSDITNSRRKFIAYSATQTLEKDRKVNVRISGRDLATIQKRALEEGIALSNFGSEHYP